MRSADRTCAVAVGALLLGACAHGVRPQTGQPAEPAAQIPAEAVSRFDRAVELMHRDDRKAERVLVALTRDHPGLAGPWVNLGILYLRNERLDDAEAAFLAALERNPAQPAAQNGVGVVYRQKGRFADALTAYDAALAADPGYALAFFNRGVLNDLYLQRPAAALSDYQRYQALQTEADERVAKWIDELRLRIEARTARADER